MDTIVDVIGISVGQVQDEEALTGCTVILTGPKGAVAGVDIRGGAPGTRETALLSPDMLIERVHGILLTGGSAFGLESATGVMQYLKEKGIGFDTGIIKVPILPGAVLFDLLIGDPVWPDARMGYRAALLASKAPVLMGNCGAGCGATVGKMRGPSMMMKGGVGSASLTTEEGITIGALVVVNALGDVKGEEGELLAAPYHQKEKRFLPSHTFTGDKSSLFPGNTTLGVLATDARLTKAEAQKVAQMCHDGLARAIYPCHTLFDGDTIFALSTGEKEGDISFLGAIGANLFTRAVERGIKAASSVKGAISWQEIEGP